MKRRVRMLVMAGLLAAAAVLLAGLPAQAVAPLEPAPQINAKGVVVWFGYDSSVSRYQIYRYDPKTGEVANISQNNEHNYYPQINDKGQVVWQAYDSVSQIYRWDPKTLEATNIPNSDHRLFPPDQCQGSGGLAGI